MMMMSFCAICVVTKILLRGNFWGFNLFLYFLFQIVYSDDEEVVCKNFTREFYKLVSIKSGSTRSLQSQVEDSEEERSSERDDERMSPTPSEAGRAAVASCSSSDSGGDLLLVTEDGKVHMALKCEQQPVSEKDSINSSPRSCTNSCRSVRIRPAPLQNGDALTNGRSIHSWRRSNGWTRVSNGQSKASKFFLESAKTSAILIFKNFLSGA